MWPKVVERLQRGEAVELRPSGQSMTPIIRSRQLVRIEPVDPAVVGKGDVVLAKVAGNYHLHLVSAIQGERVQISNNHGHVNGWTNRGKIYGRVVAVEGVPLQGSVKHLSVGERGSTDA
jgi:hypothetical protein